MSVVQMMPGWDAPMVDEKLLSVLKKALGKFASLHDQSPPPPRPAIHSPSPWQPISEPPRQPAESPPPLRPKPPSGPAPSMLPPPVAARPSHLAEMEASINSSMSRSDTFLNATRGSIRYNIDTPPIVQQLKPLANDVLAASSSSVDPTIPPLLMISMLCAAGFLIFLCWCHFSRAVSRARLSWISISKCQRATRPRTPAQTRKHYSRVANCTHSDIVCTRTTEVREEGWEDLQEMQYL